MNKILGNLMVISEVGHNKESCIMRVHCISFHISYRKIWEHQNVDQDNHLSVKPWNKLTLQFMEFAIKFIMPQLNFVWPTTMN